MINIYRYEFRVDDGNQHDYYKYRVAGIGYFKENTMENRLKFINTVGVNSNEFANGDSSDWFGYKITEIEVN